MARGSKELETREKASMAGTFLSGNCLSLWLRQGYCWVRT